METWARSSANRSSIRRTLPFVAINQHSLENVDRVAVPGGWIQFREYQPHDALAAARVPLIVTHGGPGGSSTGLYDALHELADERPVIFYDQLGSKNSPANLSHHQMTLERFAQEPLHLIDALDLKRASLLGHSWGGSVMTAFALNHPEKVHALVLSSPLLSTRRWISDCNRLLAAITPDSRHNNSIEDIFNQRHFCRTTPLPPMLVNEQKRNNRELYEHMWGPSEFSHQGVLGDLDFFPRLHELTAKTLLICGEHDTATPETLEAARSRIGDHAHVAVLANAGHKSYIDQNRAYLNTVKEFLQGSQRA